jgi:hypothetical protein
MRRFLCLALVAFIGCAGEIPHMQFTPAAKAPEVVAAPKIDEPVRVSAPAADPLVEEPELPKLTLPEVVTGKAGAFIKVSATTNGREVRWQALDDGLNVFPGEMLKDSKSTVVTGEAGDHRLMAYTALADVPSDPAVCIVRITGPPKPEPKPDPRPEPKPDPKPEPPPVVVASSLWIVCIDDALGRSQQTAALLSDVTFWNQMRSAGHQFASIDKANPAADKFAAQITQAGGLPCVVLMDGATHKVLAVEKLPADKVAMAALISRFTGK